MTKFLRTFTHIGFFGEKTHGALVDDNGLILFVQVWGWFEVDADYIAYHDAKIEENKNENR